MTIVSMEFLFEWVKELIWPFVRIGAMFMSAPIFGARSIPIRIRIILALILSLLIAPLLPPMPAVEPMSVAGFMVTANQVLIGVSMGFLMQLVFSASTLMGQSIAMSMGLGFASAVDPQNGVTVPVVSQFFLILTTLIFLALDGHLIMLASLVNSFTAWPVSVSMVPAEIYYGIVHWAGYIFAVALLMALPVMVSVLLVNVSFGVMTRAAPQLNIFAVGFPITLLVGFIIMFLSIQVFASQITDLLEVGLELLMQTFSGGAA